MKKVDLKIKELQKYNIIKNLVEKNGNKTRATIKLSCTVITVNRLIQRFKTEGKMGFHHKNNGQKPINTIDESTKQTILNLYKNKYCGTNFTHFKELLIEIEIKNNWDII